MNGCECYTNVRNPQDNDTDYNMGITVSVPGERVPRKIYPHCLATVCLEWYELNFFSTGATCPTQISIESLCQGECIHGVYGAITYLVCNS